jgi:hypothetical protein
VINLNGTAGLEASMAGAGAGGIAGYNQTTLPEGLTGCFALNPSITTAGFERVHRVVGKDRGNEFGVGIGVQTKNYAYSDMTVTIGGGSPYTAEPDPNGLDGANTAEKPVQTVYTLSGWDFNTVWTMGADGYPHLRWE